MASDQAPDPAADPTTGSLAPLRVALVQADATVGDLAGNAEIVRQRTRTAAEAGARLVVFPEMFLTGYPVEDLSLRKSFIEASREHLTALAEHLAADGLGGTTVVVGYLDRAADGQDRLGRPRHSPQNAAAVLRDGEVVARYAKHHLPELRGVRRVPLLRPWRAPRCVVDVAAVDGRPRDLRGPVAGGWAGHVGPRRRRRPARGASTARPTSATRTTPGSTCVVDELARRACRWPT